MRTRVSPIMFSNCFVIACLLVSSTVATNSNPNECIASGDVHYHTFDGADSIDVQGHCMHTMARPCCTNSCQYGNRKPCPNKVLNDFHVMVKHHKESPWATVAYVGDVVVELCGCTVVMKVYKEPPHSTSYSIVCGRHVDANRKFDYIEEDVMRGRNVTCPTEASWFEISTCMFGGDCIHLDTSYGVKILLQYRHLELIVPDEYKSRMCGICGNFDGNSENDYKTKDGLKVFRQADKTLKAPGSIGDFKVGNSWHVHNCDSELKCQLQTTLPRKREIRATGDAAKCLAWMKESCPNAVDNAVLTKCKVYMITVNKECIRCRAGGKNCKCDAYQKQVESAIKSGATRSCPPGFRDKCLEVMRKGCPDDNERVLRECMVDSDAVAADAKKCASRGGGCDTVSWTKGNEAAVTSNAKAMCGRA